MIDISTLDIATLGIQGNIQKNTYLIDPKTSIVYSRKTGTQYRLYGSVNSSNVRTYTLQPAAVYGRPIKLREDRLISALAKYNTANTNPIPAAAATNQHGWVIGKLQADGRLSFSQDFPRSYTDAAGKVNYTQDPVLCTNEKEINLELERLAKATPGTKFIKARIEAVVQSAEVIWS